MVLDRKERERKLGPPVKGEGARVVAWLAICLTAREDSEGGQDLLNRLALKARLSTLDRGLAFEMTQGVWRRRTLLDGLLDALGGFSFLKTDRSLRDLLRLGAFQHFSNPSLQNWASAGQ